MKNKKFLKALLSCIILFNITYTTITIAPELIISDSYDFQINVLNEKSEDSGLDKFGRQ